ncbi:MAG: hypothetical protein ACYC25_12150 [Paludibacter sp.]
MSTNLKWKRSLFSKTCNIYLNGRLTGKLVDKGFSKSAEGELNGVKYSFKTQGIFRQNTEITDVKRNMVIGEITYSNWMRKATLTGPDKNVIWKYDNTWNTRWSVSNSSGIEIKYRGSTTQGEIDSNTDDPLLLLSGLFVTTYYRQVALAVIIASFIPIWTSAWR